MKTLRNHLYDFKQGLSFEDLNEEGLNFEGATLMRPLVFDFPNDAKALSLKQTYMFGKALLVNPVTEGGVSQWTTYLPVNKAGWYNFRSNRHYPGGQEVTTATDLSYIPVFVRGGSILPYGPTRQYATQTTDEPLEIRVYPGADATFTLYEDDGCSNNYRQGKCSRTPLSWDQTRKRLTIGARQGSYDGMAPQRSLKITVIGSGTKDIVYKGKKTTVTF